MAIVVDDSDGVGADGRDRRIWVGSAFVTDTMELRDGFMAGGVGWGLRTKEQALRLPGDKVGGCARAQIHFDLSSLRSRERRTRGLPSERRDPQ